MEAIQTYKQYKTECAESLKGNFFWLINNILKSSLIFYQVIVRKERNNDFSIFHHIFSYFRVGEFLDNKPLFTHFLFNFYHGGLLSWELCQSLMNATILYDHEANKLHSFFIWYIANQESPNGFLRGL